MNDLEWLKERMIEGATESGATVISVQGKQFDPQGVTVLILLSESHFSIHSYPERGFASIDCYTCGDHIDPQVAVDYLLEELSPSKVYITQIERGIGSHKIF